MEEIKGYANCCFYEAEWKFHSEHPGMCDFIHKMCPMIEGGKCAFEEAEPEDEIKTNYNINSTGLDEMDSYLMGLRD